MAIEIKNIKKKFKNNLVLDGIDLTIEKGDVIGHRELVNPPYFVPLTGL